MTNATAIAFAIAVLSLPSVAAPFDCASSRFDPQRNPDAIRFIDTGLAAVTEATIHFATCPDKTCTAKAYLVTGDIVLTSEARPGWICAHFPNKRGGTTGWLPDAALKVLPVASNPPLSAWTGTWQRDADASIDIKIAGGKLVIEGTAFWQGANPANIHDGEIDGMAVPAGGTVILRDGDSEFDCRAELKLIGPYLEVGDNNRCGGLNVTFTGVYRRQ